MQNEFLMTNSHWLGLITVGSFALFALLAWAVSNNHPDVCHDPAVRRRTQQTALFLLIAGMVGGYFAFAVDDQLRAMTLHEEMVAGNTEMVSGLPASIRTISFVVEHPGVKHTLLIAPTADLLKPPTADAEITFSITDPGGTALVAEHTEKISHHGMTDRERADWDSRTVSFTPTIAGMHALHLAAVKPAIPRIHIRIEDPQKRDGKRMPGY